MGLLPCVAAAFIVLWVWSYERCFSIRWERSQTPVIMAKGTLGGNVWSENRFVKVSNYDGGMFFVSSLSSEPRSAPGLRLHPSDSPLFFRPYAFEGYRQLGSGFGFLGFWFVRYHASNEYIHYLRVPYWFLTSVALITPSIWLFRKRSLRGRASSVLPKDA